MHFCLPHLHSNVGRTANHVPLQLRVIFQVGGSPIWLSSSQATCAPGLCSCLFQLQVESLVLSNDSLLLAAMPIMVWGPVIASIIHVRILYLVLALDV